MALCPKCGREGKRGVKRVRSKGRVYWYEVWRHPDGSTCVVRRLDEDEVSVLMIPKSRLVYELRGAKFLIDFLLVRIMERELELWMIGEKLKETLDMFKWQCENIRRLVEAGE